MAVLRLTRESAKRKSTYLSHIITSLWIMAHTLTATTYATYPYSPSFLFDYSSADSYFVYILEPPSTTANSGRLLSLSTSQTLSSDEIPTITVSESLPFIEPNSNLPYIAVQDIDGSILIYSGECSGTQRNLSIWRFSPSVMASKGQGTWSLLSLDTGDAAAQASMIAPNYLATALSFSQYPHTQYGGVYIFGGMCPNNGNLSGNSVSEATYSDQMLSLTPESSNEYLIMMQEFQTHPIAEAGSTMTALLPSYSNASDGSQTIGQDYVLIGGNTQTAFINMTQLAVFSLPQAQWTFVSVNTATAATGSNEDLALLEPRSGHTATLTTDGSQIVIFGGWVGDFTTAAEPQLAILDLGVGYGGSGPWSWYVPSSDNSPMVDGQGIYGHGAIMLPGNILMITGGFSIANMSTSTVKRQEDSLNTQSYFFNATSGAWLSSYTENSMQTPSSTIDTASAGLNSSQKAGLGAGLTFGTLALCFASLFGFLYWRKLREKRESLDQDMAEREIEDLSELTRNCAYDSFAHGGLYEQDENWNLVHNLPRSSQMRQFSGQSSTGTVIRGGVAVHNAERTGLDLDIPSPHRGLRHSMRNNYHIASKFDEVRPTRFPSNMHAIEERSEEDSSTTSSRRPSAFKGQAPKGFAAVPACDPFRDPDDQDEIPSNNIVDNAPDLRPDGGIPSPAEERQKEMTEWIKDWAAADAVQQGRVSPNKTGRTSPEKSDRTLSALSDVSNFTTFSGSVVPSRAVSRAGTAGADSDSFTTAKSVVSKRQNENAGLLTGIVRPDEEPTFTRAASSYVSRHRGLGVMGGIVGSVKRAIPKALQVATSVSGARSISLTSTMARPIVIGGDGYYDYSPTKGNEGSKTSSPIKIRKRNQSFGSPANATSKPSRSTSVKRSVSDSAAKFWATKQGAAGWNDSDKVFEPYTDDGETSLIRSSKPRTEDEETRKTRTSNTRDGSRSRQSDFSEDWDVEAAIEDRVVQVMFTVPREKLRVVNADPRKNSDPGLDSDNE